MRNIGLCIAGCVVLLAGFTGCSSYSFKSEAAIKRELLREIPPGTSSEAARVCLRRKTGAEPRYDRNFMTDVGKAIVNERHKTVEHYFYGAMYSTLATYGAPSLFVFNTRVETRLEFDAKDRLIDIEVNKYIDGL